MLPKVSLIVPAKNEEKVIGNCIDSLLKLDYPKSRLEIIVAVDGSTDRTVEICKSYGKKIRLIESKPKNCKAEILNEVIPKTRGDIIGIYDADCVVDRCCLKIALGHFSDTSVSGVSGAIKSSNKDQNILTKALSIETCFMSFTEYFLNSHGANSVFFGKNMFIRKSVFDDIGYFDTKTFLEDSEMSFRMRRSDHKIKFEPKAITWTEEPSNIKSYAKQRSRWVRGYLRIKNKHHYDSVKLFLSDAMHGLYFYASPFLLIMMTVLMLLFALKINLIFISPMIAILFFNTYLLVKSRLFYGESLKDLLYMPIFLFLGNLISVILMKSWYDERTNKDMSWFKSDRSGLVLK
jgi:cellulose synthase/poly-beta-1,6-N-acetylglucosamine synthase-like glycosyltransferase